VPNHVIIYITIKKLRDHQSEVICWAKCKLGEEKWLVSAVVAMNDNESTAVRRSVVIRVQD